MKIFRMFLENPYNTSNIEYRLSIPPSAVMKLIAKNTEESDLLDKFIPLRSKNSVRFSVEFENNYIFKISQKWSAKGYINSYEPLLVGWVTSFILGSSVSINFEVRRSVEIINIISVFMLMFFTVSALCIFISDIFNGSLKAETFLGVIFVVGFWLFLYGFRKFLIRLGLKDKKALQDFIEGLFKPFVM